MNEFGDRIFNLQSKIEMSKKIKYLSIFLLLIGFALITFGITALFYINKVLSVLSDFGINDFAIFSTLGNYMIKDGRIISFRGRTFYVQPYSYLDVLKFEFKAIVRILRSGGSFLLQGVFYRIVYVLLYPFWKNRTIWLFIDRDIIADDNAEHLYKYCIQKKDDGIEKYFIINKDSPDYERLNSSLDNVVAFGSFKHRIKYF